MSDNDTHSKAVQTPEETDSEGPTLSRRSFVQAGAALAGTGLLGLGSDGAAASGTVDPSFFNWRAREARQAWERGYRGRTDRTVAITDSGIEARHPDLGPWNGVRAVTRDGDLFLTTDGSDAVDRAELDAGESFSGTVGPGTFATPDVAEHQFTAPAGADEIEAALSWDVSDVNDLEFYVATPDGERITTAATADHPETITLDLNGGESYVFGVETYASTLTTYEIAADYFEYQGELSEFDDDVFGDIDPTDPTAPKVVGWYDEGGRYGRWDEPRDPNGHGTHCTSIMSGSGRASTVDPATVVEAEPRTTLVLGESLSYEIDATAGTGVFGSAYGTALEIRIEGPDGRELASSTVGTDDNSAWDNNVAVTPTVHDDGTATYTVYVTAYDGELAATAEVNRVSAGAFKDPTETAGDRVDDGDTGFHTGVAPNQSIVGLQGLSGPTVDLAEYADEFSRLFNVRAVNMSWGYVGGAPLGAAGGLLSAQPSVIKDISEAGILVSAAAGNAATPANGNGAPGVADEAISVVATGPLDGIAGYSSGGLAAYDEDTNTVYRKPDVTAPGGTLTDPAQAAKNGEADTPEEEQGPIRDYQGLAGTSMAAPFVTGSTSLVAEAMESGDAPRSIRLPDPESAGLDDVRRLKQVLLATASETAFTAAPYHRAHVPTYEFGGRDPYEGYGRVNLGAAIDAVTRELTRTTSDTVGLNVPEDERAVAGYVQAGPGTVDVSVSFSHYSGANAGAAEGAPHVDLFVYDAENPAENGEPNIVGRAQGLQGEASVTVSLGRDAGEQTFYVVAKLVNVPGVVNGYDLQAHLDLTTAIDDGFFVDGSRSDDGSVFTGGQTNKVDITVNPSENATVRDVVPSEWTVLAEYSDDVERVKDAGDVTYVYFKQTAQKDTESSYTYFAEAPDDAGDSGEYVFGPAQVDAGEGWVEVAGTSDTNIVLGQST